MTKNTIQGKINRKEYAEWQGANIIIAPEMSPQIQKWKESDSSHNVVITPYSYAIIWLINELKDKVNVDYISKYCYYKAIADTANQYINRGEDNNVDKMLLSILDAVKDYISE